MLPQSYQNPNLSEGADRVGGQLRGDKECPFSGVTNSGRVWRKVPESDARSVQCHLIIIIIIIMQICKAPTLRFKALNKHTYIMYIEMENVIQKICIYISTSVQG